MNARTIHVNIRQQPELYKALMYALNNGTDYEGWHVSMYQELHNSEEQRVGEYTLRKRDADDWQPLTITSYDNTHRGAVRCAVTSGEVIFPVP